MKKVKIAIADDQLLFLRAMVNLLNSYPDFEVVAQAPDGENLLEQIRELEEKPDIVLLDLRMPKMDGMQAASIIKEKYPASKIIILSSLEEEKFVSHMMGEGASAYLAKNSEPDEVYRTIAEVHKNGYYFSELVVRSMHAHLLQPQKIRSLDHKGVQLTKREKEILALICKEFTMNEIAARLNISLRTVEGHRNNLLGKTGSKNTAGLVAYAIQYEWYKPGE